MSVAPTVDYTSLAAVQEALASSAIPGVQFEHHGGLTPLHYAARAGSAVVCDFLIGMGAEVDALTHVGFTPLHTAAKGGKLAACECLIVHGADIEKMNSDGCSPLSLAVDNRHLNVCRLLLERGASANATSPHGLPLLSSAVTGDHVAMCVALISFGADVMVRPGPYQRTLLMMAACSGFPAVCQLLLESGVSSDIVDGAGDRAFQLAVSRGHLDVCVLLRGYAPEETRFKRGRCNLELAARCGRADVCEFLLAEGADQYQFIARDLLKSSLQFAANGEFTPVCQLLVAYGGPLATVSASRIPDLASDVEGYIRATREAGWKRRSAAFRAYVAWNGQWW